MTTAKESALPEPWLRGPFPGIHPLLAPAFYSFQAAREDLARFTEGLTTEELWARPRGLNSVGRELKHIAGSVDRLVTYLEGRQLGPDQMAALRTEDEAGPSRDELLAMVDQAFLRAESVIRAVDAERLAEPRVVGRKQLPTTVIGLVVHMAEHTQRHVGRAIGAARLAQALRSA
jgi:uncharacterized damage-inducible protein DinB